MLLLYPAFLLFLVACVMTVTLPLHRPPFDVDQRLSRSLSSTGRFRSRSRAAEPLPAALSLPPPAHAHRQASGARRSSVLKRKNTTGANKRPSLPEVTGNNRRGLKPGGRSQAGKRGVRSHVERRSPDADLQVNTAAADAQAGDQEDRRTDRRTHKLRWPPGESGAVGKQQPAVEKPPGEVIKRQDRSEDSAAARKNPRKPLSQPAAGLEGDDGEVCASFTERLLSEADRRRLRVSPALRPLPWLSQDDVQKMRLLAGAQVVSKAKLPAHGQVLQVALAPDQQGTAAGDGVTKRSASRYEHGDRQAESHGERCQRGFCALVKRTDDWVEVFAFHLDRVLGLNRSLPVVLRAFRSQVLPYRYISGVPRPVVWWDPDIQHLASRDNDQNSVPLSWVQYQQLLQSRCGIDAGLWAAPCVGIHHSEWARLALFDFLLQVNNVVMLKQAAVWLHFLFLSWGAGRLKSWTNPSLIR